MKSVNRIFLANTLLVLLLIGCYAQPYQKTDFGIKSSISSIRH